LMNVTKEEERRHCTYFKRRKVKSDEVEGEISDAI